MYHLAIKPISRSAGRSATAAAAYRAGSVVIDERTGEVHDYTRKGDIEHSEIVVPAGSPAWATERVALWNAAEAAEKRKDARVARDYEVAIPKELSREQGIALVRDFAHRLVDAYGVAVDFNVHRDELRCWDGSEKGWQGYHAHLLTSTRRLGRDGFGEKASIELSDTKRKSLGLADGAAEIARVREWWEIDANRHLEQANQAQRIDRRSLKDQGIDRDPTVHLGPWVTALERDGVPSRLGDINRQVVAEHSVRVERKQQVAAMAVEIGELAGEIVERKREGQRPATAVRSKHEEEKETKEAVARALAKMVRERDLRVQRVLARAQARQQRRDEASQALARAEPAAPTGLLAAFRRKGHQQALLAWAASREAAERLLEQARRLAERLVQAAKPERLVRWAIERLRREQPEAVVRLAELQAERKRAAGVPEPQERPACAPEAGALMRDRDRDKALQEELARKGRQSLQERGVLRTDKKAPEPERNPPERKKDRGLER